MKSEHGVEYEESTEVERPSFEFVDLEALHKNLYWRWFNDEKVRKNLYPNTPRTEDEISDWVDSKLRSDTQHYYIILRDGVAIGHVGLKLLDSEAQRAEFSTVIGQTEIIGTGEGLLLAFRFMDYVFDSTDIHYLVISRKKDAAGARLFLSLGFSMVDSVHGDDDAYEISRNRWSAIRGGLEERLMAIKFNTK